MNDMATIERALAQDLTNAPEEILREAASAFTDGVCLPPLNILALQGTDARTMQPGGGSQT
jgi:hypothetical protein